MKINYYNLKMPLHLIAQCCACKGRISLDLYAIKSNHGYSGQRFVYDHFDVNVDHESSIGFLGINWSNKIKVEAIYKPEGCSQMIIDKTFDGDNMEYQNYKIFNNKYVFHARISDYRNKNPDIGFSHQEDIEYNERREQQRLEQLRREQERREEQQRQLKKEYELRLSKLKQKEKVEEEERKNDLKLLEQKCKKNKKTTFKRHKKLITLDIDEIFDIEKNIQISKSDR